MIKAYYIELIRFIEGLIIFLLSPEFDSQINKETGVAKIWFSTLTAEQLDTLWLTEEKVNAIDKVYTEMKEKANEMSAEDNVLSGRFYVRIK